MTTLASILVLAAESVEESEPSKTPFYIAGGVLVAWALVLSAFGLLNHDFPKQKGASRGVMGISFILVVATMASIVATA